MAITPTAALPLKGADPQVLQDIKRAANATSIDFGYLVAQAYQESSLKPDVKAANSTATGLYQFTEGTWLREFQAHGAQYGYGDLAAQITTDDAGKLHVPDGATRSQILALRNDPTVSSELAAELAKENRSELESALSRPVTGTDLYLAHFLGAGGAQKLLNTVTSNGGASAAGILPAAAAANPAVFYDDTGAPRSVSAIYNYFADKIEGRSQAYAVSTQAGGSPDGAGASSPPQIAPSLRLAGAPPLTMFGSSTFGEPVLEAAATAAGGISRHALDQLTLAALQTVAFNSISPSSAGASILSPAIAPPSKSHKSDVRPI
ncbi:MAG TPA: lytic transglycosylase domain-containing protein [Alphaproteobacteria bacterium]|nr:lytic transglycosylase domain-containing protein [Alphaproteobacteria bacterium]